MEIALVSVAALCALAALVSGIMLARARERAATATALLGDAQAQVQVATSRLDAATEARLAAERRVAGAEERCAEAERRLADFERQRQELLDQTKAATLETAQLLSSKLIEDHRRETAEARREAETQVRQASEQLVRQVDDLAKMVTALNGQVQEKSRVLDTVWRSLSSPGGAGQIAEIGLANTLRGFGLECGRDYVLQASTEDQVTGERLRPDAVVYLPGNGAMVIDAKASKFLVEIAAAEGDMAEAEACANFAQTMNGHLKALAGKNYRGAMQAMLRDSRGGEPGRIVSLMYLPNEGAVEKLCRADPLFLQKAREAQIILAGPAALHCALVLAASEINRERQIENQQRIIEGARALLEGVGIALGHANAVGRGLKTAAENFAKFSASVNQRLLPRARRLGGLGVQPAKALPASIPSYVVNSLEGDQLIEGEAAEVADEAPEPRLIAE